MLPQDQVKPTRLTGIYLSAIFRGRYNYRKILAVTFTNKATAEMKSRILGNLHRLSGGEPSEYLDGLMDETGKGRSG
jgi:ATP-dependent helicase/nuclease subunit A